MTQQLAVEGPADPTAVDDEDAEVNPFERYDPLLHAGIDAGRANTRSRSRRKDKREVLAIPFVKKYIQYAKMRPPPQLTQGAASHITYAYTNLRNDDDRGFKRV